MEESGKRLKFYHWKPGLSLKIGETQKTFTAKEFMEEIFKKFEITDRKSVEDCTNLYNKAIRKAGIGGECVRVSNPYTGEFKDVFAITAMTICVDPDQKIASVSICSNLDYFCREYGILKSLHRVSRFYPDYLRKLFGWDGGKLFAMDTPEAVELFPWTNSHLKRVSVQERLHELEESLFRRHRTCYR